MLKLVLFFLFLFLCLPAFNEALATAKEDKKLLFEPVNIEISSEPNRFLQPLRLTNRTDQSLSFSLYLEAAGDSKGHADIAMTPMMVPASVTLAAGQSRIVHIQYNPDYTQEVEFVLLGRSHHDDALLNLGSFSINP